MVFLSAPVLPAGSPRVTIPVTIPAGTPLFVPIITVECSVAEEPPFHGDDEAELRACANGLLDLVTDPYAEIDGRPVKDPGAYRVESPLFRYGPLPAGNVLGLPPGTQSDAVGAGYFLLLPPFSAGVHRIIVRANVADFRSRRRRGVHHQRGAAAGKVTLSATRAWRIGTLGQGGRDSRLRPAQSTGYARQLWSRMVDNGAMDTGHEVLLG